MEFSIIQASEQIRHLYDNHRSKGQTSDFEIKTGEYFSIYPICYTKNYVRYLVTLPLNQKDIHQSFMRLLLKRSLSEGTLSRK